MDNNNVVIDFNIGLGGAITIGDDDDDDDDMVIEDIQHQQHDDDDEDVDDVDVDVVAVPETDSVSVDLEPYDGMEFDSEESAKAYYNSYARRVGFSTRVSYSRRSRRDGSIIQRQFVCAKEGFRNMNEKRTKDRELKRPRTVTRVGCKASLSVKKNIRQDSTALALAAADGGKWVVYGFVKDHNHDLVPPDKVHCLRSHRQISGPAKTLIDTLAAAGMGPSRIMSALVKEYGGICNVGFTEVDCKNYMRNNRIKKKIFNTGDVQLLLDYLRQMHSDNPSFFYAIQERGRGYQYDDDNDDDPHLSSSSMSNVFWADSKARLNFTYFGDTLTFDTSYRSNRYRLPLATFTGINHHGQPVLFGCAFLINESEESFVWLFKTFLMSMSDRIPISITTDHNEVIRSAITQVFPNTTRHCFCKWNIFKKCQEKLSNVFLNHPNFEADFQKCVNLTDSIDEFESSWLSLVDRYDLRDQDWLLKIYSARKQWVPLYLRDTFFAEMSLTQRSDTMNSYFDGYVNASTNLTQFFKQYEKAIESRNEKEVKADYDTMNTSPVLKTPSPMEKQASQLYTRRLFVRFQDELVGTLTCMASKAGEDEETITYQVVKYGEDHKTSYVKFNVIEMKASCSCQTFEFSGILCRHILAVFRVTNILTLPSHYILKRWTRNAKSSVTLDEEPATDVYTNYLESHTVRYNTLRHEAFKYVDEGAKTIETYDAAMNALQEASKRVSIAAKKDGRTVNGGRARKNLSSSSSSKATRVVTSTSEDGHRSMKQHTSEDEMENRIREMNEEVECANWKCEVYRGTLLSVLKDMDNHKQQLSVRVQNIKLSMKDLM